jgi:hypothetical protein
MHTDFLVGTAFYMRFRDWQNRRYTPSKILLYTCIPEARFVGVIVTW